MIFGNDIIPDHVRSQTSDLVRRQTPNIPRAGASFYALKFSSETLDSFFRKATMAQICLSRSAASIGCITFSGAP